MNPTPAPPATLLPRKSGTPDRAAAVDALARAIDPDAFAGERDSETGYWPGKTQRQSAREAARRALDHLAGVPRPGPRTVVRRPLTEPELEAVVGMAGVLLGDEDGRRVVDLRFTMRPPPSRGVVELEAVVAR